jgi:hypothetical protein
MATRMAQALATTVMAAGLVVGIALGGSTGASEAPKGVSGVAQGLAAGAWAVEAGFDPDPLRRWPSTSGATTAGVAIDVVANYCTPTSCRPQ